MCKDPNDPVARQSDLSTLVSDQLARAEAEDAQRQRDAAARAGATLTALLGVHGGNGTGRRGYRIEGTK